MAVHEFGIMPEPPQPGKRYDEYEPQKYRCISVKDDDLEEIVPALDQISFFWHTLDVRGNGIAYCGITLIPPSSAKAVEAVITDLPALSDLQNLLQRA